MNFRNRADAGGQLAGALRGYSDGNAVVLALPRGGVPVGWEVARALHAPLDVVCVRKIGAPGEEELGVGAVAEDGAIHLDHDAIQMLGIPDEWLRKRIEAKREEVAAREARFRRGRPRIDVTGKTVILVDDGVATGGTFLAAMRSVRLRHPAKIIAAIPVAAPQSLSAIAHEADEVVCLTAPAEMYAIGMWYEDFRQVDDSEVVQLLVDAEAESVEEAHPA